MNLAKLHRNRANSYLALRELGKVWCSTFLKNHKKRLYDFYLFICSFFYTEMSVWLIFCCWLINIDEAFIIDSFFFFFFLSYCILWVFCEQSWYEIRVQNFKPAYFCMWLIFSVFMIRIALKNRSLQLSDSSALSNDLTKTPKKVHC